MAQVRDVIEAVEAIAPPWLAMDGDPIGLHAGDPEATVERVAVSLDASLQAIRAAAAWKADMLAVHHPRFFHPITTLAAGDSTGERANAIIRSGMAVYSAHTNFDVTEHGTNDHLAELAGLVDPAIVVVDKTEPLYKLAVFVPTSHLDQVLGAVTGAGAGHIGNYADCTFRTKGTGTFRGGEETTPFIGTPGVLEHAEEYRLETVFRARDKARVLAAMHAAHPYEEVAYDLYTLAEGGKAYGFGRAGALPKKETLGDLAARMARLTGSAMTQATGKMSMPVKRAAVWAGAGVHAADFARCDVQAVIAGEVSYHELENFADRGIGVVTLGHEQSEAHAMPWLAAEIQARVAGCRTRVFHNTGPQVNNVAAK